MNLFTKTIRRCSRSDPNVDLLSAAFGLPFLRGPIPGDNNTPGRIAIAYETDSDSDAVSEAEGEEESSSSEEDRGRRQSSRHVSQRTRPSRPLPYSSPHPSKKMSPRKSRSRRHHAKSSPISSTRKSSRRQGSRSSRSSARRSNAETINTQQPLCYPPAFPIPSLNQAFKAPVCQPIPQQPVYYQNQHSYVPHQPSSLVHIYPPQIITSVAQPATAGPLSTGPPVGPPASSRAPVSVPPVASNNTQKLPGEKIAYSHKPHNFGNDGSSDPFSKEVQRLQKHIDAKMADLAEEPNSRILRRDLRRLQDRHNIALNRAISVSKKPHERQPSLSALSNLSQPVHSHNTEQAKNHGSIHQREQHLQRDVSPQRIQHHHVCSGCGNTRSTYFHKKFPVGPGPVTKLNFCESCREVEYQRGVVRDWHFCFNCGTARSKEFHAQNPVLPGEPIFINYCNSCMLEFHDNGSLPETSVLSLHPRVKAHLAKRASVYSEDDADSMTVNRHRNRKHGKHNIKNGQEKPPDSQKQTAEIEEPRGRRSEPQEPRKSAVSPPTAITFPESPYCPSRSTGSSGRREERKSSGTYDTDTIPQNEKVKAPRNYQSPYVEDSVSAAHSRTDIPSPNLGGTKTHQKVDSKVCEPQKSLSPDFVLKSAMASDRSSSEGSRKAQDETPQESPRYREGSFESERSDPSSSKSSGSKTVRFKQSVDIRTPLAHDEDTEFSEPESPGCLRSPGSPLISRNKPSYYHSYSPERKPKDKYLHPHYGQSSKKSPGCCHEYLHTPDIFQAGAPSTGYSQGAFSKAFDNGMGWDSFRSPEYLYREQNSDESSVHGHYVTDEEFPRSTLRAHDHGYHEQYMESTVSLPSRLSNGSVFSSFFKKSKNKASSVPPRDRERFGPRSFTDSQATPCPQHSSCSSNLFTASFTDTEGYNLADEGSTFENTCGQAPGNPYYKPRKRSFPDSPNCTFPIKSEKSAKGDREQYSPVQSDRSIWKNAFDPIPTIEEASTAGDSPNKDATDMLEYKAIVEVAFSVIDEDDEESSSRDSNEFDEATEINNKHVELPIRPLVDSIAV
ncbi:hypothetical protein F53441_9858 [Fusarium austroafricanum]|uniref:Uncharacterized protein n=1 Tax=Fusarium austroafricanum TaxID=2364996 RepID=A0A8H4KC06_9HYPO|nr:hypothetical protein F53441_9858 [Fusarium austroafricanum]